MKDPKKHRNVKNLKNFNTKNTKNRINLRNTEIKSTIKIKSRIIIKNKIKTKAGRLKRIICRCHSVQIEITENPS